VDSAQAGAGTQRSRESWAAYLVEEFLRVYGLGSVIGVRREWLVGVDGVMLLRRWLIEMMLLENRVHYRGGVKRLNPLLTEQQRRELLALPALAPTEHSVISASAAYARAMLPRARRLLASIQVPYPEAFEAATLRHLRATVGERILP
jgi:hypothetical protein